MRRLQIGALLALVGLLAPATPCLAQFDGYCFRDFLGLYTEEDAVLCQTEANVPGQTVRLWLIVTFGLHNDNPVAELHADFSGFPSEGVVTEIDWAIPPIAGGEALDGQLLWRFDPPWLYPGPTVVLATIDLYLIEALPWDVLVSIENGATVDVLGQPYAMLPHHFTFNCTGAEEPGCDCMPPDYCPSYPWLSFAQLSPPPDAIVSGEFVLEFTVSSFYCSYCYYCSPCNYGRAYEGEVLVGGLPVASFSGSGQAQHAVTLSTAGLPPGSALPITLRASNQYGEQNATFDYLVDVEVPAASESWSRVKSRY